MSKEIDGTEILRMSYMQEVYESFFRQFKVVASVVAPCMLECVLSTGFRQQTAMLGGEQFTPVCVFKNKSDRQTLRLAPVELSEFRYAEVLLPALMFTFTSQRKQDPVAASMGQMPHSTVIAGGWEGLVQAMLAANTIQHNKTNQELIDLALENERKRQLKQGIESHDAFGTW